MTFEYECQNMGQVIIVLNFYTNCDQFSLFGCTKMNLKPLIAHLWENFSVLVAQSYIVLAPILLIYKLLLFAAWFLFNQSQACL